MADGSFNQLRSLVPRIVVVAPTYNNARTLAGVLDDIAALGLAVIVVNDGCDDHTAAILERWIAGDGNAHRGYRENADSADRHVVTHDRNLGKAAALRSGFLRARELGFSHALTIDTDGQHDAADIPVLLSLANDHPDALVLGARPTGVSGYPIGSRLGRAISNLFVRLESGARVSDSQCGLRVYPLAAVAHVNARTGRFGFETEVITRLAWAGAPIVETPVRCIYDVAGGRTSHFRPVLDSIAATWMHARLLNRSLMPWPVRSVASGQWPVASSDRRDGTSPDALLAAGHLVADSTGTIAARLAPVRSVDSGQWPVASSDRRDGTSPDAPLATGHWSPATNPPPLANGHLVADSTGTIAARLGRWMNPMRIWRQVRHDARERRRLASSMAAGMLLATLPPLGFKTVVALLVAKWFRLQPLVVIAVSSLNTPPTGPLLTVASIATGHVVLHGKFPKLATYSFSQHGAIETIKTIGVEWAVGSAVVGTTLAVLVYAAARTAMLLMPQPRPASPPAAAKPQAG